METLITAICALALSTILSLAFILEPRKKAHVVDESMGEFK